MKKLLSLFILSVLLVSLFSCGGKEKAEAYLGLGHEVVHQDVNGMPIICVFAAAAVIDGKTDAVIAIDVDAYMAMAAISGGTVAEGASQSVDSVAAMEGADFDAMISELAGTVVGKTASEIEALITAETAEEKAAMLKAIACAAETAEAPCKKADKPGVALKGSLSTVNAKATNGKISADVDFAAVALDANEKVTAAALDSFKGLSREFDATGALIAPAPAETKRERGYGYGMKSASSIGLEWFEQAEGFCAYLVGKTADEIGAIGVEGGYPTEKALLSSCTMGISGYIAVSVAAANAAAAPKEKAEAYLGLGQEVVHRDNNGMPMICVFAAAAVIDGKTDAVIAIDVDAYMAMAAISGGAVAAGASQSVDSVAAMGGADFDAMISQLAGTVVGKTAKEIKALITAETAEEEAAMLKAISDAAKNADTPCKKADKPGVALKGSLSTVNADALQETNGKISADVDFAAVALDADGKVAAAALDSFKGLARAFDATGALIAPATAKTKRELGYDYGMKGASSIGLEWFEQAEGFCAYLVGKTADEIGAIGIVGGYPTEQTLLSSCTMGISGYIAVSVAAANAAATE